MKQTLFSFFLLCCMAMMSFKANAQDVFAPVGAEWWYQGDNFNYTSWPGGITVPNKTWIDHVQVTKDTIINDIDCRQVTVKRTYKTGDYADSLFEEEIRYLYLYDNLDTTFIYNVSLGVFTPLYVFNVKVGDLIHLPHPQSIDDKDSMYLIVEAVKWEDFDGQPLKSIYTRAYRVMGSDGEHKYTYNYGSLRGLHDLESTGKYTQRLGMTVPYLSGFFPNFTTSVQDVVMHQEFPSGSLICYKDNDYEVHLSQEECNYIPTPVSGINTIKKETQVRLSPNPARQTLRLEGEERLPSGTVIKVYDLNGSIVLPEVDASGRFSLHIDVSTLAEGLYILRLESPDAYSYHKLVIQNW